MSGKVDFKPHVDPFSQQKADHERRKQPDSLDSLFQSRREAPVRQEDVDKVVEGAYSQPHDLFGGLTSENKV